MAATLCAPEAAEAADEEGPLDGGEMQLRPGNEPCAQPAAAHRGGNCGIDALGTLTSQEMEESSGE